ncbi:sigma-70 family RNA polymerase sigma factor [Actinomadura sp. NEAU-AAG7]|uniref:sigma-70 family RNA polymerase sigma factor n=1 Tax=Actinomadura sp. NEAU-AAG7 TaxID=2839640 RepID=UPI001BE42339|nr:sigma-70 family RNA polymerase sigma factor [Actinomadura sp. NEAU-AAG7]MBT2208453.1 sigma-70 family RNA polymerase sigma factor [Actinomadura sp. NEAU-AAG7]
MAAPGSTGRRIGGLRSLIRGPVTPVDDHDAVVGALYREYQRPLLTFVLRLTGDRQWAEDVVQETMIRAWRSADQLDERVSLMPWLATVARRIVIDNRRHREARPVEVGDGPLENLPTTSGTDGMDGLLRKVVIAEALASLSDAHREALTETVLRDRTVNQAAEALGIPVGTVKSRVYYALRALRVAMEERGVTA